MLKATPQSEPLPTQAHTLHRVIDVTDVGHIHPRKLCLDCHVQFEERDLDNNPSPTAQANSPYCSFPGLSNRV